jgi:perosamine synthetase
MPPKLPLGAAQSPDRLAVDGGEAVLGEGPPCWPPDDVLVREALLAALADGSWGRYHGPHVERLTRSLGELFESPFVLPCCSGTFAVELALRAAGVAAGDEVLLAGYDFPGNFRAIEAIGARPVLVDIDPASWAIDHRRLVEARSERTRAVIVSHLHGGLAAMREVMAAAADCGLSVIEDTCQCPGAVVQGRLAGTWGDCGVLSFGGSKLLTAGRGGALLTRDAAAHQRAKIFCERGNHAFPLSELQAAVLLPQLGPLAQRNGQRAAAVARLLARLENAPGLAARVTALEASHPAYYKVGFLYDSAAAGGRNREQFIVATQAEGVAIDAGFRGFGLRGTRRCRVSGELGASRRAAEAALVLHHPVLLEPLETIDRVAEAILKVLRAFE